MFLAPVLRVEFSGAIATAETQISSDLSISFGSKIPMLKTSALLLWFCHLN